MAKFKNNVGMVFVVVFALFLCCASAYGVPPSPGAGGNSSGIVASGSGGGGGGGSPNVTVSVSTNASGSGGGYGVTVNVDGSVNGTNVSTTTTVSGSGGGGGPAVTVNGTVTTANGTSMSVNATATSSGGGGYGVTGAVQNVQVVMAQSSEELLQYINQTQTQLIQQAQSRTGGTQTAHQNQVVLAVHTMLASRELLGGIGQNVSAIAIGFNNSIQATVHAEERIQKRSWFSKFFFGGDEDAADEIEQEVGQNQERIQQFQHVMLNCTDCYAQVKTMLQEQVQNVEQEQERLTQLAQEQKQSKGLLGWLWK